MTSFKRNLLFAFYLVAGVVLGALIAHLCPGIPYLSWLSYNITFGISAANPLVVDLAVLSLTLGLRINMYVAQIFTLGLALFCYSRTRI